MIARLRASFGAKILAVLLGTVGVLLAATYFVVRSETNRQVALAVDRAVSGALTQLAELEDIQRLQIERLVGPLITGPRAQAALEEATASGDLSELADRILYDVDLAGVDDHLVALTDRHGTPLLTFHAGVPMAGGDPMEIGPVARELLDGTELEVRSYRHFDGTFYHVRTLLLEGGVRPVGTVSVGLPFTGEDMRQIGAVANAEVCFVLDGACVAGTAVARDSLAAVLAAAAGAPDVRAEAMGTAWAVRALPLMEERPGAGSRVVAVALDPVLAPFRRITHALLLGGALALALAALMGSVMSRGLTRPVRALAAAAERVGRGDYEVEVTTESTDEIGALAAAFNDMTRGLRLKERYRSVLNKVVSREVAEELMEGGVELGGESRPATVLFGDIRGFTAMTQGMDPQGVIRLLNECMQRLSDAVEAEGGVVDKFVGDEIMAVFGAPISRPDDAARAVRAALRMRAALAELNAQRRDRGDAALGLGVGLNTGEVVAGNMGSANRLNYTVLGTTVNLAARLCSAAAAGEILATRSVLEAGGGAVEARALGARPFKGFRADVDVFAVEGYAEGSPEDGQAMSPGSSGSGSRGPSPSVALLLAAFLAAAGPAGLAAQDGAWPTLRDAGIGWIAADGSAQIDLSGQLDLELYGLNGQGAGLAYGDGVWVAPRLRLFTDVFLGDHVYGLLELRADRGPGPTEGAEEARVEQAYVRLGVPSGAVMLQAGRFTSPFGSFGARHLTEIDPFVRPPLPYDYRTVVAFDRLPPSRDAFLGWRDQPEVFRAVGAPPVWGVPYQWGAMFLGAVGPVGYRLAAMNSSPSSEPESWGWRGAGLSHPSYVASLVVSASPTVTVGASWNRGPYLEEGAEPPPAVPNAPHLADLVAPEPWWRYDQQIVSVDVTVARGPVVLRAEAFHDRWEVASVGDAVDVSWTVEAQADVAAGVSAALRWGGIDFRPLDAPGGVRRDWDYDVTRWEASVGYRLARNAGVLVSGAVTDLDGPVDPADDLVALRLWWAF